MLGPASIIFTYTLIELIYADQQELDYHQGLQV